MQRRRDERSGEWRSYGPSVFVEADDGCVFCSLEPGGISVFDERPPGQPPVEVVVWSHEHDASLARIPIERLDRLVEVWAERYRELGARDDIGYVLIVEDRLAADGADAHPFGRIRAFEHVPNRAQHRLDVARAHMAAHGRCLLCDLGAREEGGGGRVIASDEMTLAFVPYAPRFPYEVQIQPKRHATDLLSLSDPERASLARVLQRALASYDRLFGSALTYALAIHQSPTDDGEFLDVSHLHIELMGLNRPGERVSVLRAAELAAGAFTVELSPEEAAEQLRGQIRG